MGQRPVLWPKLPATKAPPPESPDPSFAQEDPETRIAIAHYLLLADRFLSSDEPSQQELDEVA
jgi:hypothetical protein